MSRIRTFIAVDVAAEIRQNAGRLIDRLAAAIDEPYKWVEPANMHLTLNFLGDVPESDVPSVCRQAESAVAGSRSFGLEIAGLGAFPELPRPRVLWLGLSEGAEELISLQHRVTQSLESLGFPPDRNEYRPHLTLGRRQRRGSFGPDAQQPLLPFREYRAGGCLVPEVVVYASYLDRRGPTHTPMSRIELAS